MSAMIKSELFPNGVSVELHDKNHKGHVEYNYLVEVSFNGRTTPYSKTFIKEEDAEKYYKEMVEKYK